MNKLKRNLHGVLMILLGIAIGILLIIDAVKFTEIVFRICGIAMIVMAVILVIRYLLDRRYEEQSTASIVTAIIAFVVGMVLAIGANMIVEAGSTICAIFYGAVMIVNGILKISEYASLKKQGAYVSGIRIVSGLLSIALGVVVLILCTQALQILGIVIGICLIAYSLLDVAALVVAHRLDNTDSIYDTSDDDADDDIEDE